MLISGEVVMYLNVRRGWCILMSGEIVVYLNVRRGGVS